MSSVGLPILRHRPTGESPGKKNGNGQTFRIRGQEHRGCLDKEKMTGGGHHNSFQISEQLLQGKE